LSPLARALAGSVAGMLTFNLRMIAVPHRFTSAPAVVVLALLASATALARDQYIQAFIGAGAAAILVALMALVRWKSAAGAFNAVSPLVSLIYVFSLSGLVVSMCQAATESELVGVVGGPWQSLLLVVYAPVVHRYQRQLAEAGSAAVREVDQAPQDQGTGSR
jgi:hypothetical protein